MIKTSTSTIMDGIRVTSINKSNNPHVERKFIKARKPGTTPNDTLVLDHQNENNNHASRSGGIKRTLEKLGKRKVQVLKRERSIESTNSKNTTLSKKMKEVNYVGLGSNRVIFSNQNICGTRTEETMFEDEMKKSDEIKNEKKLWSTSSWVMKWFYGDKQ